MYSPSEPWAIILMDVSRALGLAEGLAMSVPGAVRPGSTEEIANEIAELLRHSHEVLMEELGKTVNP